MEKSFKRIFVFLSFLLVASIILMAVSVPAYNKAEHKKFDIFSASTIADNIKNLEMNMTSIIYVKN